MRKIIIIGEVPEILQERFDEMISDGVEVIIVNNEDELKYLDVETIDMMKSNPIRSFTTIGITGMEHIGRTILEEMKNNKVEIVSYDKPSSSVMRKPDFIDSVIIPDLTLSITKLNEELSPSFYENKNRYKKREYKMSAGSRCKPKKRKK